MKIILALKVLLYIAVAFAVGYVIYTFMSVV